MNLLSEEQQAGKLSQRITVLISVQSTNRPSFSCWMCALCYQGASQGKNNWIDRWGNVGNLKKKRKKNQVRSNSSNVSTSIFIGIINDGHLPLLVDRLFSALFCAFSVRHFMALSLAGQGRRSNSRSLQLYCVDFSYLYICSQLYP